MSFLDQSKWRDWAREWGFFHSPQGRLAYPNEWMAGRRQDRLVRIGWGGDRGRQLYVMIRFPKTEAGTLREALRLDDSLAELPGWNKVKPVVWKQPSPVSASNPTAAGAGFGRAAAFFTLAKPADLMVSEQGVLWSRRFRWRRPKPARVRLWVERLIEAVARISPAFQDRCETCSASRLNGFVMFEGTPMLLCSGCRERFAMEGRMAEQHYEQEEANYLLGSAFAVGAAAAGGGLWALAAIVTNRIYAVIALGIGALVGWCYRRGAHKVDRIGQIIGAVLTIASVVFGQVLLYAYQISLDRPDVGFRLDAGWRALRIVFRRSPGEIVFPLILGVAGALAAVAALQRPRFTPKIETPEESVPARKTGT